MQERCDPDYALGHSNHELERLIDQARFFGQLTRSVLVEAGVSPGMRVLDVGCGPGDVTFLAASLVGPDGEVVGVDQSPSAIEVARNRAKGLRNVRFVVGDAREPAGEGVFDAVIGRLVLMYFADPAEALRAFSGHVRSGGLVIFHEFVVTRAESVPKCHLAERCLGWITGALSSAGAELAMGYRLYSTFLAAGLPAPQQRLEGRIGGGPDSEAYRTIAGIVRTLIPVIERAGLATAAEIDIDTLEERLRSEVVSAGAIVVTPPFVGAWARKP
jgi:ubiquinone/menaquinone biosynthesis C-methylase UbiE